MNSWDNNTGGTNKLNFKKKITVGILSAFLFTGTPFMATETVEAASLTELEQQKQQLQNQSGKVNSEIQKRQNNMNNLQAEKTKLENEVARIQTNIDELIGKIEAQEQTLNELKAEIERLQKEIEKLKELIAQREEKLENQARSIQTKGNTTNMVDIVLSAESLSDLIGRLGVVSQIVEANNDIVEAQIADQEQLEVNENQVQEDKAAAEAVKKELESNRNTLVAEKKKLDDKIIQVAELYQMNSKEKESFVNEQKVLAQKTSALNREINAEKDRIAKEKAAREAAEREAARKAAAERKAAAQRNASASNTTSSANSAPKTNSSGFIRPSRGYVTSHYGYRIHPIRGTRRLHAGIDIGGGGPIVAAQSGTVVRAQYHSGWGYYVKINHGNGLQTLYAHMQPNLRVSVGQHVSQGQQIGTMGTTGTSTGVHLHFEVYKNGRTVNPAPYLGL